jgi:D-alanine-D-alanine ligase
MTTVLVLGGGPDAERPVSLNSAANVAAALRAAGRWTVVEQTIDRIGLDELKAFPGDAVFPVLHGSFGEGGPLQDLLEADGRPYVGCRPRAARLAMDKMATKLAAAAAGVPTAPAYILNSKDMACPTALPVVVKPVHDGSSVGLHICRDAAAWEQARAAVTADLTEQPGRAYMVEKYIPGRELTVGLLAGEPLPIIHIAPAQGVYDYEAKYARNDTRYHLEPALPPGMDASLKAFAKRLGEAIGVRHISRVDFILDGSGNPWLLEINTMPGCTSHSLVPMAARHRGIEMPELCSSLVEMALADHGR